MLQITERGETALRRIREENDVPQDAALRIGAIETPDGQVGLGFAFTDGPEDGDQTISENDGFRVYLANQLALPLTEAAIDETANVEGITLHLRTQAELNGSEAKLPRREPAS